MSIDAGIQVGVVYPQIELNGDPEAVRSLADAVEAQGYRHLVAYDHVLGADHANREPELTGPYDEDDPFHDPFVLFAYLAGRSETLEFASGILILPQRQTALVAKQAADLAVLSGDRFRMGVGVGWNPVEYDAWDVEAWTRALGRPVGGVQSVAVVEAGPLRATLEVRRAFGRSTLTQLVTLRAGSPRLDIAFDIDWQEDEALLSLHIPLDVHARDAACGIQFGHVLRPTHQSTSWDAAKFEVCAHRWVDFSEAGWGVAVLDDGRYGHSVQEPDGGGVRVSLLRAAKYPDPEQDHGRHELTISVFPHGPGLEAVVREAECLNTLLRWTPDGAGRPADAPSFLTVDGDGIEVSAVKLADDGSGDLVVRLAEVCGARRQVTLRAPQRIHAASLCDLLEEPHTPFEVSDGIVVHTLRPFEVATLRLSR